MPVPCDFDSTQFDEAVRAATAGAFRETLAAEIVRKMTVCAA